MDRVRLHRGDMPRPVPTIAEQIKEKWPDFATPACKTCWHAYQVKPTPAAEVAYQCMRFPPAMALLPVQGGVGVQIAPRILPGDFFCHEWSMNSTFKVEQIKVPQ